MIAIVPALLAVATAFAAGPTAFAAWPTAFAVRPTLAPSQIEMPAPSSRLDNAKSPSTRTEVDELRSTSTPSRAAETPANGGARMAGSALEPLVPEVAGHTFSLPPGPRDHERRLAFTPSVGRLGGRDLYALRFAYNPSAWLGYEIGIGHNPGRSVHALTHTLSALLRYPVPFRVQPYATAGYGMVLVFPGQSVNADPVTENVLALGGGLEAFVRDDVALRVEAKRLFVPGDDPSGGGATYEYAEISVGLSFYRLVAN